VPPVKVDALYVGRGVNTIGQGDGDRFQTQEQAGRVPVQAIQDQPVKGDNRLSLAIDPDVLGQAVNLFLCHRRESLGQSVRFHPNEIPDHRDYGIVGAGGVKGGDIGGHVDAPGQGTRNNSRTNQRLAGLVPAPHCLKALRGDRCICDWVHIAKCPVFIYLKVDDIGLFGATCYSTTYLSIVYQR
jgi:hypothetical protein